MAELAEEQRQQLRRDAAMPRPYSTPTGHYGVTGRPYWIDQYGRYTTEDPNGGITVTNINTAAKSKTNAFYQPKLTISRFSCQEGEVSFTLNNIPGCCGISVLTGVNFYPRKETKKAKEELYDAFQTALLSQYNDSYGWRVAKLVMSDTEHPVNTATPSMWDFAMYADWYHGTATPNPKTGRTLMLFEMDRKAVQRDGNPGYKAGGVGRDWWKRATS